VKSYLITLDIVGAQRDARYIRTLVYQGGLSVVEAWEPSMGKGGEWVEVRELGSGPDGYYVYTDPGAAERARNKAEAELQQVNRAADYFSDWPSP
jgi:hypothetical protein